MTLLPIVLRELRVAAGRPRLHAVRSLAAALGLAVIAWLLLADTTGAMTVGGRHLFRVLGVVAFLYCLLAGSIATTGAISGEFREGTLGLLFLTDLRSRDVVLGKLAVAALPLASAVIGLLPLLSVSLLVGGVNLADVGLVAVVLANTLFLSLAAGMLVSALSRKDSRALTAAILLPVGLAFGPYVAGQLAFGTEDRDPFSQIPIALLLPSPFLGLGLIHDDSTPSFRATTFILNQAAVLGLGWLALAGAAAGTARRVRDGDRPAWLSAIDHRVRAWIYGSAREQARRRGRLLDLNPMLWLGSRHRHKSTYLWMLVLSLAAIAVWSGAQTRGIWFEWKPALLFLLITHGAVKLCFLSEACHRLGTNRQQGGFELLLTTPTSVESLAHGHFLALRRTFGGPLIALLAMDLTWLWLDLHRPEPDHERWVSGVVLGAVLSVFLADLVAIRWGSLWQAVAAPSPARAVQACAGRILLAPWALFLGIAIPAGWIRAEVTSARGREAVVIALLAAVWCFLGLVNAATWNWVFRHRFLTRCRYVAAEGMDESDRLPWKQRFRSQVAVLRSSWRQPFSRPFWMRHRHLRFGAVSALATLLGAGVLHWNLERRIATGLERLGRAGVPLTEAELQHWQPAVAPSRNAVPHLRAAVEALRVAPGVRPDPIVLPSRSQELTPRQRAGYEALLRTNAAVIQATELALDAPDTWFEPEAQFAISPGRSRGSLPLRLNGLLLARTILDIEEGRFEEACEGLLRSLRFAELIGRQPRFQGQCVRHAGIHLSLNTLERLLARTDLNPAQLARLDEALQSADSDAPLRRALTGEYWLVVDARRQDRPGFYGAQPGIRRMSGFPEALLRLFGRASGVASREFEQLLTTTEGVMEPASSNMGERLRRGRGWRDQPAGEGYFLPDAPQWQQSLGGTLVSHTICTTRLRAARLAIAVEMRRHTGGQPNASLQDLPPAEREREDPFTGESLQYVALRRGYSIRSGGQHGEDVFWINRLTNREGDEAIAFVVER